MGQAWGCGAGMELWGGIVAMGQAGGYGAGLGLWVRAGAVGQDCGSALSVQPPDPHMWSAVGQRCGARPPDPHMWGALGQRCGTRPPDVGRCGSEMWDTASRCGALWVRDVGRCGSELCIRPPDPHMWGAVGQAWGYGAGVGLWGRPGAVGQEWSYGAGLGLWGRAMGQDWGYGAGLELPVRPPAPHMWGAVGQSCAYSLQTHSCGALWVSVPPSPPHSPGRPTAGGGVGGVGRPRRRGGRRAAALHGERAALRGRPSTELGQTGKRRLRHLPQPTR